MKDYLAFLNFVMIILIIAVAISGAIQALAALLVFWGIAVVVLNTLFGTPVEPVKRKK